MIQYCVWITVKIMDSALTMKMVWLPVDHVIQPLCYGNGVGRSVMLLALLQNCQKVTF